MSQSYYITFSNFCRSSVLIALSQVTWNIFDLQPSIKKDPSAHIIRAYASKIFSLVLANGTDFQRKPATPNAILDICNSFFHISESIGDDEFKKKEVEELIELFKKNPHFSLIPEGEIRTLGFLNFFNRSMRSQWSEDVTLDKCFRSWRIYVELKSSMQKKTDIHKVMGMVFSQSENDFLRGAICIFSVLSGKSTNDHFRAIFDVDNLAIEGEMISKYDVTKSTIHLCAQRLVGSPSEYTLWFNSLGNMPDYYSKYSPTPLFRKPILRTLDLNLNVESYKPIMKENSYLVPSPRLFIWCVSKIFEHYLNESRQMLLDYCYDKNQKFSLTREFGSAIEVYFEKLMQKYLSKHEFERIPEVEGVRSADFVISTPKYEVFIEIKKSMSDLESINVLAPIDVYEYWGRLISSCEQLSGSMSLYKGEKIKIGIVCFDDNFAIDTGAFLGLNYKSGVFKNIGIDFIESFSFDMLEMFIMQDEVAREIVLDQIVKNWKTYVDDNYSFQNFAPISYEKFDQKPFRKHYSKEFEDLFGFSDEDLNEGIKRAEKRAEEK